MKKLLSLQSVLSLQFDSPQSSVLSKSIQKQSDKLSEKKVVANTTTSDTKAKSNDGGYIWIV